MFKLSDLPKERFDEIMGHIGQSQGNDLKSLLMQALQDKQKKESPMDEAAEGPMDAMNDKPGDEMDKPKGIAIEKVSVAKDPMKMSDSKDEIPEMGGDADKEMSDDELKELLSKYLSE